MSADETTYNFTRAVIEADPLEIAEAVHPPAERPVTLYDLINAFEEAKEEGATRMVLEEERAKARAELERARKAKVSGMMHSENLEEEIAATWMRILEGVGKADSPAARLPLDSTSVTCHAGRASAIGIPGSPAPEPTSASAGASAGIGRCGRMASESSRWWPTISSCLRTAVRL